MEISPLYGPGGSCINIKFHCFCHWAIYATDPCIIGVILDCFLLRSFPSLSSSLKIPIYSQLPINSYVKRISNAFIITDWRSPISSGWTACKIIIGLKLETCSSSKQLSNLTVPQWFICHLWFSLWVQPLVLIISLVSSQNIAGKKPRNEWIYILSIGHHDQIPLLDNRLHSYFEEFLIFNVREPIL